MARQKGPVMIALGGNEIVRKEPETRFALQRCTPSDLLPPTRVHSLSLLPSSPIINPLMDESVDIFRALMSQPFFKVKSHL